jgi:exosortase/archaeosortase family protein
LFAATASMLLLAYWFPYPSGSIPAKAIDHHLGSYAAIVGVFARLVDSTVVVAGPSIEGRFHIQIIRNCDAMVAHVLMTAAVVAHRAKWAQRLWGVVAANAVLAALNIARLVCIYAVGAYWTASFDIWHRDVFPMVLIGAAAALFLGWLRWVRGDTKAAGIPQFAWRASLVYALLSLPWPVLPNVMTSAFDDAATAAFGALPLRAGARPSTEDPRSGVRVALDFQTVDEAGVSIGQFEPAYTAPDPRWYTILGIRNAETGARTRTAICLRPLLYSPFVMLIALTLGARVEPRRRAWRRSVALTAAFTVLLAAILTCQPIWESLASDRVQVISSSAPAVAWIRAVFTTVAEGADAFVVLAWAAARRLTLTLE